MDSQTIEHYKPIIDSDFPGYRSAVEDFARKYGLQEYIPELYDHLIQLFPYSRINPDSIWDFIIPDKQFSMLAEKLEQVNSKVLVKNDLNPNKPKFKPIELENIIFTFSDSSRVKISDPILIEHLSKHISEIKYFPKQSEEKTRIIRSDSLKRAFWKCTYELYQFMKNIPELKKPNTELREMVIEFCSILGVEMDPDITIPEEYIRGVYRETAP